MVLRKYEAYNEARLDLAVRNPLGEFQERIDSVRVRAHVGPPIPALRDRSKRPYAESPY